MKCTVSAIVLIIPIVCGSSLFAPSPARAWTDTDLPVHTLTVGGFSDPGEFNQPSDVAVAPDGSVYVLDMNNFRVQKFSASGDFLLTWNGGSRPFDGAYGIAVAPDGGVYIVEMRTHRVQKFTATGEFILTWGSLGAGDGQFNYPTDVAVAPDGSVFVTEQNNYRIQKFSADGVYVTKWGGNGTADGQLKYVTSVAVASDGSIYTTEGYSNTRVQKFAQKPDGMTCADMGWTEPAAMVGSGYCFVTKWGSVGSGDGQFNNPGGIAVAPDTSVYVGDSSNHRIQKFSSAGAFQLTWGTTGSEDGQFNTPQGVAVTSDSTVYVVDTNNYRVQKFDSTGVFLTKWGTNFTTEGTIRSPRGVAEAPDGTIYIGGNNEVNRFTRDGAFIQKWGSTGSGEGQFNSIWDLDVGRDGSVYVVDTNNHRIQKFTPTGTLILIWGTNGTGNGQFQSPWGIGLDYDGYVYIADDTNNRIQKFTSDGVYVTKWGNYGTGDAQFKYPEDVAVAADGSVYTVDYINHRVAKFAPRPDGVTCADMGWTEPAPMVGSGYCFVKKWGSKGTADGQFQWPYGVSVSSDGSVYVADSTNSRVQKFTPDGTFILKWGGAGIGNYNFYYNSGIGIAPDDSVFVADTMNHRVLKYIHDRIAPVLTDHLSTVVTGDATPSVTGITSDALSAITSVEHQIGGTDGPWSPCTPEDGAFDSLTESYRCTSLDQLPDGFYQMFVRTTDSYTNTTAEIEYTVVSLMIDTVSPVFEDLPDGRLINVEDDQILPAETFTLRVKPSDVGEGIDRVEFYVDGALLCTDYTPDENGEYTCDWNTRQGYLEEREVRVVVYDEAGNSTEIARVVFVELPQLEQTGTPVVVEAMIGFLLVGIPTILHLFRNQTIRTKYTPHR